MATLASLSVKLLIDAAQYNQELAKTVTKTQKIAGQLQQVGDKLTGIGKGLTFGLTLPLVGVGAAAIDAASDLDESVNKINVVFGESAETILAWSQDSAMALGQSQQQALEAAGTYGNLLTSIGLTRDVAADMSVNMVQLASDLASFNNASPEETLLALRSALTGEFEPMKRFGAALNQSAVQAKALELGLAATKDEITPAIKAQAAYALILEQTANAQGDFAATSDGLANSQRILKAELQDQAAALGQELLPLALDLVKYLRQLIEQYKALDPEVKSNIVKVLGLAAALGPLLIGLGSVISAVGSLISVVGAAGPVLTTIAGIMTGPVGLAIAGVAAGIAALYLAWKNNLFNMREAFDFWKEQFQIGVDVVRAIIDGDWRQAGELLSQIWSNIWDKTVEMTRRAINRITGWIQSALDFLRRLWDQLANTEVSSGGYSGYPGTLPDGSLTAAPVVSPTAPANRDLGPSNITVNVTSNDPENIIRQVEFLKVFAMS